MSAWTWALSRRPCSPATLSALRYIAQLPSLGSVAESKDVFHRFRPDGLGEKSKHVKSLLARAPRDTDVNVTRKWHHSHNVADLLDKAFRKEDPQDDADGPPASKEVRLAGDQDDDTVGGSLRSALASRVLLDDYRLCSLISCINTMPDADPYDDRAETLLAYLVGKLDVQCRSQQSRQSSSPLLEPPANSCSCATSYARP